MANMYMYGKGALLICPNEIFKNFCFRLWASIYEREGPYSISSARLLFVLLYGGGGGGDGKGKEEVRKNKLDSRGLSLYMDVKVEGGEAGGGCAWSRVNII